MMLRFSSRLLALTCLLGFFGLIVDARAQTMLPDAQVGQNYSFQITTSPPAATGTVYGATNLPTGISINSYSGLVSGQPSVAGSYSGTISLTSNGSTNNFSYTVTVDAAVGTPVITSGNSATGTVGQLFSYTLTASNSPTSFSLGALPAGLSFSSPHISGTPSVAGTYSVNLSANNGSGSGPSATLTLTINPAGPVPAITSATSQTVPLNAAFSYAITASNTPTAFAASGLPFGLSVNTATGAISGTPTVAGIYTVGLSASNANGVGATTALQLTLGALPVVTTTSLSATVGTAATLPLAASNSPLNFNVAGLPTGLTVNASTGVISGTPTSAGNFTLTVSANNATGTGAPAAVTLTVNASGGGGGGGGGGGTTAPTITTQPSNLTVTAGGSATFTVAVAGTAPITYQWQKNGVTIVGATATALTLAAVQAADMGSYTVVASNSAGSVASAAATLTVLAIVTPVAITAQPTAQTAAVGGGATFIVAASGTGTLTYQWLLNGSPIAGATNSTLTLTNLSRNGSANYSVVVTGASGSVTSSVAVLTVLSSRLVNVSARAVVGTNSQVLVVGYVVGGSGSKQVLIRAVGPTEGQYGVSGALANPQLSLYDLSDAVIATNIGWGNASVRGASTVQDATIQAATTALFNQLYAFPLPSGSADCAMVATLPTSAYTAQVSGTNGTTGVALAELYDTDAGVPASRLVNISARAYVGTGSQVLIAGFVISGTVPETVLIRGVGPTLGQYGVSGSLTNPQLTLYDGTNTVVATNTGWGNAPVIGPSAVPATVQSASSAIFNQVYAFLLPSDSADCAMLVTLPPGTYTAQVTGLSSSTGVGLVEVYETQ